MLMKMYNLDWMDEGYTFSRDVNFSQVARLEQERLYCSEKFRVKVKVICNSMGDHMNRIFFDFNVLLTTMCAEMFFYVMTAVEAIMRFSIVTARHSKCSS